MLKSLEYHFIFISCTPIGWIREASVFNDIFRNNND